MKELFLSIEQSRELMSLGVDMSGASMMWDLNPYDEKTDYELTFANAIVMSTPKRFVPTLSVEEMLLMLPKIPGYLNWDLHRCGGEEPYYMCVYEPVDLKSTTSKDWIKFTSSSIKNAVFEMLKYCKQNDKI